MAAYPPFIPSIAVRLLFSHVFARLQLFDMGGHGVDPSYMRLKRGDWTLVAPVLFGTKCVDPSSLDDMQGLRGCRDGMYNLVLSNSLSMLTDKDYRDDCASFSLGTRIRLATSRYQRARDQVHSRQNNIIETHSSIALLEVDRAVQWIFQAV